MKKWLLALFLVSASLYAQKAPGRFTFKYEHPRLDPSSYVISVSETGAAHFHSEPKPPSSPTDVQSLPVDKDIQLAPALLSDIFQSARDLNFFAGPCEDGGGKIAFQGTKTFIYEGEDGHGSCSFNWSKEVRIQRISDQLIAIATTIHLGIRLEAFHRYDRLGLDAELQTLSHLLSNGQAAGVVNIAPVLQSIFEDDAVIERARKRAQAILEKEKASSTTPPAPESK